jgi:uncharacterized membrane protein
MVEVPITAALGAAAEVRIGRVLSRSFEVLSRHFISFPLLAALPLLLAFVGVAAATAAILLGSAQGQAPQAFGPVVAVVVAGVVIGLFFIAFWVVAQAMILFGAFQEMRGRQVRIGEAARKALARLPSMIGLGICFTLAVFLGLILLVFPAFIFISMFYVALPACIVEKLGPFDSLSRSAALTKGHRWKVFGLYLLMAITSWIVNFVISMLLGLSGNQAIAGVGSLIWLSFLGAYQAVTFAVLYHDLRVAREGVDIEQMTAVFD